MKLRIYTPEKIVYDGDNDIVKIPGIKGSFTVLKNHAPLISSITNGVILYKVADTEVMLAVKSGFIEVKDNVITVCVELK